MIADAMPPQRPILESKKLWETYSSDYKMVDRIF